MTRPNYGPNYKTPEAEAKALRAQRATSWFDAMAATLLILCVGFVPVFWLLSACGRLAPMWVQS